MSSPRSSRHFLLVAAALLTAAGCGSSTPTTPTATQTIANDVFTGTVNAPVDGTLQSNFSQFVVGQGGGTVSVTLTSAIETLPGGTLLPNVTMGLGVGTVTNGACALLSSGYTIAQPSASAQLSGTLTAATYCVAVSDVTGQLGPVAYSVSVSHP